MRDTVVSLLGIADDDTEKLKVIDNILFLVESRLCVKLEIETIPTELKYILIEVSISRYNLIGNEGMSSYSQEGESINFANIFAEYEEDIKNWKNKNGDAGYGKFKFL